MIGRILDSRFYPSGLILVAGLAISLAMFWMSHQIVQEQIRDSFHLTVSFEARAVRGTIDNQERKIREAAGIVPGLVRAGMHAEARRLGADISSSPAFAGMVAMFYERGAERIELFTENRTINLTSGELDTAEDCSRKTKRVCAAGNTSGEEIVLVQAAEPSGRILVRFSLLRMIQAEFQDRALFSMDAGSDGYMEVVMLEIAGVKRSLYFPIPEDFEGSAARALPVFILSGGLIITVLLFIVFHSLAGSRNRALEMAERMTHDLREATLRAVEANKAKSEFLASMSHEIRNPLNVIAGMGEILSGTDLEGEQRRYLDTLRKAGEHLQGLINDILDLSRIESGQLELEQIDFPLRSTLEGLHDLYTMTAREKGVEFKLDIDQSVPVFINGDPVRLRQIIVNLLGNAFKFTSKGSVTLSARMDGSFLTASVTDTGIGIPEDKQGAIFEKFTQVDASTTRKYGGTGLGLAICKRLTEMMGGPLKLSSKAGEGSTFYFSIPVQKAEGTVLPAAAETVHVMPEKTIRILLAEDSDDNALVVSAFLKSLPHTVTRAYNGLEAVKLYAEESFDLILMDNQMPEMDGLTAVQEIRRFEERSGRAHTPILALTADSMKEDVARSIAAGCDGHVTKPVTKQNLLASVSAALLPEPSVN